MYARVSTFLGPPGDLDRGVKEAQEEVVPKLRELQGCKGIYLLVDRASGRHVAITLWESEEALRATEERATQLRQSGGPQEIILSVDRYEVAVSELIG
ncbi:MAG TPA: antibiotic biosynthesis monooxygenase [Actinomycetota bacterium]|nr:antibiotic biosynthesis monooxygenase [Actinomycetota bacterium]